MNVTLSYLGRSGLKEGPAGQTLSFAPNLAREAVAFDAPLLQPLRFREAMSALHDVVVSNLRFRKRDKTAYEEWKKSEQQRLANLRQTEYQKAREAIEKQRGDVPPDLDREYSRCLKRYWQARQSYANYLRQHDLDLWRKLMPCDPVITVADDVVFFECFSADESSYACLKVNRADGFGKCEGVRPGTTNVDYSWDLYHHFQALRSYRETRFHIDPAGFEVKTHASADYREEKIDLPSGWLRGFMQIQQAMALPMRKVTLSREAVYSLLAYLQRHKPRTSPRALRFELLPGRPPRLVMEPWEQAIVAHGLTTTGKGGEPIRVWGKQRLLVLARLLPLVERFEVFLLGTGLPAFWVAHMGEMQLTLGLSGWTTNDWTRGSALDLLMPPVSPAPEVIDQVARYLRSARAAIFAQIDLESANDPAQTAAALNYLAHTGQLIHDLPGGVYRWRQIMPQALGEAELGPDHPELVASREITARKRAVIEQQLEAPNGGRIYIGKADGKPVELLIDTDGRIRRGKCVCSHHVRAGIRMGPCRHLLALRWLAWKAGRPASDSAAAWYRQICEWSQN